MEVDQVLWVVEDLEKTIQGWRELGFDQILNLGNVSAEFPSENGTFIFQSAKANLGGANITWIQSGKGKNILTNFHKDYGDGAMSLVHELPGNEELADEIERLSSKGVSVIEKFTIHTDKGPLIYVLMDTNEKGKYFLGYTYGNTDDELMKNLSDGNLHNMKINQYAFAIRQPEPVSGFWASLGFPEFQISHPELDNMHYYGQPTDHKLIQGWQRHGTVAYEWCIPVKPPIVYEDHINTHGEGIHHLAFSVDDMDIVIDDYKIKGYVNSMGGTWGKKGQPGSGRYEYIDLEKTGGVTMELLWNYK
ncbi:MAG: VOC family protein [Cyclobacteriaceae bacterium]|nr:VOC family protein [Cyclobacteriaceae bacterium]